MFTKKFLYIIVVKISLVLKTSQYRVIYFRIYTSCYYVGLSIKKDFAILYVKKSVFHTAVVSITSVLSIYTIIMLGLVLKKTVCFFVSKEVCILHCCDFYCTKTICNTEQCIFLLFSLARISKVLDLLFVQLFGKTT